MKKRKEHEYWNEKLERWFHQAIFAITGKLGMPFKDSIFDDAVRRVYLFRLDLATTLECGPKVQSA